MGKSNLIKRKKMPKFDLKAKKVYYSGEDEKKHFVRACKKPKATSGRKCVVAGSIVILLSGRFRGKRVVVLKRLESGLLLVTGPYKVNGVPLKRVNEAYVIPTSTTVDVKSVNTSALNDAFFAKTKVKSAKTDENAFFNNQAEMTAEEKAKIAKKREAQKEVDGKLMPVVKNTKMLAGYLRTRFSLRNNQKYHMMGF